MQLDGLGCHVFAAENGASALQLYQANQSGISIALLDVDLPDIDGVSLARELRRISSELPVVLITGNPSWVTRDEWQVEHIVMTKPFTMHELNDAMSAARNSVKESTPCRTQSATTNSSM